MASHYEVVIKGNEKLLRAYISGYMTGKGLREGYIFSKEHPIDLRPIRDFLKYHGDVLHLICSSELRSVIRTAVNRAPEKYGFEIVKMDRISRGYFHFKFYTAHRKSATGIKRLLSRLPAGVKLVDFEPKEVIRPDAKGAELYSPVHHFVYRGKGVAEGDAAGIYELHRRMEDNEFFNCKKIEIHHH